MMATKNFAFTRLPFRFSGRYPLILVTILVSLLASFTTTIPAAASADCPLGEDTPCSLNPLLRDGVSHSQTEPEILPTPSLLSATIDPKVVTIVDFIAQPTVSANTLTIQWETSNEVYIVGFHIWRQASGEQDYDCLTTETIPSNSPGMLTGNVYQWTDFAANPQTQYTYLLETMLIYDNSYVVTFTYTPPPPQPLSGVMRIMLPYVRR